MVSNLKRLNQKLAENPRNTYDMEEKLQLQLLRKHDYFQCLLNIENVSKNETLGTGMNFRAVTSNRSTPNRIDHDPVLML